MVKRNYGYEKRQKELAKQKKKEEKRKKKQEKHHPETGGAEAPATDPAPEE